MDSIVRRVFVEKKVGFDVEARLCFDELAGVVGISGLVGVRILRRYDMQGLSQAEFDSVCSQVLTDPLTDIVSADDTDSFSADDAVFAVEYLPGAYDQRADAAAISAAALTGGEKPLVKVAKVYALLGVISAEEAERAKKYIINPIETRETGREAYGTLELQMPEPPDVEAVSGFIGMDEGEITKYHEKMNFAMTVPDLAFCQKYFRDDEKRDPSITELRLIDTYWSDHCRHTTFLTELDDISINDENVRRAFDSYSELRGRVYGERAAKRPVTLMDLATINMKDLRGRGLLDDLEVSEEVNACTIEIDADVGGEVQKWLVMFKNETHNHPTEIEPFGGAATCLGGGIRDPLSGRACVYQAMRITGAADPRAAISDTIHGKLPQRKITTSAASGYSSYGNQVGVASGHIKEIYHPGYVAKRMELGALVGAAPRADVVRGTPKPGDVVILLGGRTGRDGIGGATGSSKGHNELSLATGGAEVQKGNPPIEHMIMRLFRCPEASRMIIRCNDFGAGGVSVAIGELARGLDINLDSVPAKYNGLDGTELAISESQERMAVVISAANSKRFMEMAKAENLEATVVANVVSNERMTMRWRGKVIADVARAFLDTNGVRQTAGVRVEQTDTNKIRSALSFAKAVSGGSADTSAAGDAAGIGVGSFGDVNGGNLAELWLKNLSDLNVCSQKGLVGRFDASHGANTLLMPYGGKTQNTPVEGMAAKLPVPGGDTKTATLMTFGFDPELSEISPFHGAYYAVVESIAKLAALGGDIRRARLSFQEFFEKPGNNPLRWGKPFAALLGAYSALEAFGLASVGGKDSMSGTFEKIDVPPTLVSFAVAPASTVEIISPEFKQIGTKVLLLAPEPDGRYADSMLPDTGKLALIYKKLYDASRTGKVLSAYPVRRGGVAAALSMMSFGNEIGLELDAGCFSDDFIGFFKPLYGAIVVEVAKDAVLEKLFSDVCALPIGVTTKEPEIKCRSEGRQVLNIPLSDALSAWEAPLSGVFPPVSSRGESQIGAVPNVGVKRRNGLFRSSAKIALPRVLILVTPGTNTEYESSYAFERAGARASVCVVNNLTPAYYKESVKRVANEIRNCNILMLPDGSVAGDEYDGNAKFIVALMRNNAVREAVSELLTRRDGLMLGIGEGFSALLKLGLLTHGEIRDIDQDNPNPVITFNKIGRFVSRIVDVVVFENNTPWLSSTHIGDIFSTPVAHSEGRFVASDAQLLELLDKKQITTRYTDPSGNPTMEEPFNPNGSVFSVESITSPDGRVFGRMGHDERVSAYTLKNIHRGKFGDIISDGVSYYRY